MMKSRFKLVYDDGDEEEEEEDEEVYGEQKSVKNKRTSKKEETAPEDNRQEIGKRMLKVKKETLPVRELSRHEIGFRCSMLGKTVEGDGYTYLKCTINGLKLTSIKAIRSFHNLIFVDVSNNLLDLEALQILTELPYLVAIQADYNRLTSAGLKKMKYLQCIIMNYNKITSVNDVYQPELSTLELGYNQIEKIAFENRMEKLLVLDFRNNKIADISNIDFPLLDSLYLAGNKLKTLNGLEKLVNLRILHVRNNPIRLLDGFDEALTKLEYVNLRNCKVSTLKQIKRLRVLRRLKTLVLRGCPFMGGSGGEETDAPADVEDDPQLRIEILAALPRVMRLNKTDVYPEEREESKTLMMQWIEEGEVDEEEVEPETKAEEEELPT